MRTIFIARGPSFTRGFVIEDFKNVEMYNLMCRILGIKPAPNNGTDFEKKYWFLPSVPDDEMSYPVVSTTKTQF